jgi:hypothetical protein
MLPRNANGEAIAILWGDDNSFGAETERRVGHAMDLWRAGSPKRPIFCVGGTRRSQGFSGADEMCRRLAAGGVPLDRLLVGRNSNDTLSNLREIAAFAQANGLSDVTVVANPLQAFRAWALLPNFGLRLSWSPYSWCCPQPRVTPARIWRMAHHEWLAIVSLALPGSLQRRVLDALRG